MLHSKKMVGSPAAWVHLQFDGAGDYALHLREQLEKANVIVDSNMLKDLITALHTKLGVSKLFIFLDEAHLLLARYKLFITPFLDKDKATWTTSEFKSLFHFVVRHTQDIEGITQITCGTQWRMAHLMRLASGTWIGYNLKLVSPWKVESSNTCDYRLCIS